MSVERPAAFFFSEDRYVHLEREIVVVHEGKVSVWLCLFANRPIRLSPEELELLEGKR
jgi:hypothetical protein